MKNKIFRVIFALVMVCLLVAPQSASWGDAGGFAGSSGYSSSGGSSSSGGGSSGGGSSSSSGGGMYYYGGSGEPSEGSDYGAAIIFGVVLALIVVSAVLSKRNAGSGGAGAKGKDAGQVQIQDTFDESRVQPLSALLKKDSTFDAQDIAEDISNWYVRMQNAWTAGDFTPMQPYFSDALYAQFERQLKQIKDAGQTNHIENIAVLGVNIQGWYEQDGQDFLVARVQTRIIDYYTNDETGEVVSGSKTVEKFMTYRYILSRTSVVCVEDVSSQAGEADAQDGTANSCSSSAGAQDNAANSANVTENTNTSQAHTTKAHTINCPNCGAAVDVNKSAKCPYCDSVLNAKEHDWVISAIQGLKQRNG